ncbi:MAG: flagellar hook-length control protein FliK [Pseudomonadota bacterium]
MMQQIAASKPEIATSISITDVNSEPVQGEEFSIVMRDVNGNSNKSAFEVARENAMAGNNAVAKRKDTGKSDDRAEVAGKQQKKDSGENVESAKTNDKSKDAVDANSEDKRSDFGSDKETKVTAQDSSKIEVTSDSESQNAAFEGDKGDQEPSNDESTITLEAELPNETTATLFNYVEFVTQVKDINADNDQQDTVQQLGSQQTDLELQIDEQTIRIPAEVIDAILAAQQASNAEGKSVPLDPTIVDSINNILAQLGGNSDLDPRTAQELDALDKQLLVDLLTQAGLVNGAESNGNVKTDLTELNDENLTIPTKDFLTGDISGDEQSDADKSLNRLAADITDEALANGAKQAVSDNTSSSNNTTTGSANLPGSATTAPGNAVIDDLAPSITTSSANDSANEAIVVKASEKTPLDLKVDTASEANKKAVANISALSEEAQLDSLKNLTQRVAQVVTEVTQDTPKGNEFIAALKAGVKEFKAQLADGREPGIDLKALVFDASEKAGVVINTQQSTKLDASLQQFANVLNLAVGVQQQLQQSQQLVYSPSETLAAEGVSQTMTESLKSATQQTNTGALDKAINILKPEGQQQMAERVRWMINGRNTAAEIRLDPPELGAMQVRINMTGDAAAVSFVVQSQQAKDALDMAAPRLKELFDEQGIALGQSSVQQESNGRDQGDGEFNEDSDHAMQSIAAASTGTDGTQVESSSVTQRIAGTAIGGIDFYA